MQIGRAHHVVYDCPEPGALAAFYSALLGLPITYRAVDFMVVARDDRTSGFAFHPPRTTCRRTGPIRGDRSRSIWT